MASAFTCCLSWFGGDEEEAGRGLALSPATSDRTHDSLSAQPPKMSSSPMMKPGMVPPPPGEESQTFVLPPGWQSYLSPQGRRYYVNTATNADKSLKREPSSQSSLLRWQHKQKPDSRGQAAVPGLGIRTLVALWGPNGEVLVTVDTWSGEIRAEAVFQLVLSMRYVGASGRDRTHTFIGEAKTLDPGSETWLGIWWAKPGEGFRKDSEAP
ncbi:hypothetical protein CB1_000300030 [Camelus ferus]|nr:hypothetical protein CB1_000300030 [Camelus ferus]